MLKPSVDKTTKAIISKAKDFNVFILVGNHIVSLKLSLNHMGICICLNLKKKKVKCLLTSFSKQTACNTNISLFLSISNVVYVTHNNNILTICYPYILNNVNLNHKQIFKRYKIKKLKLFPMCTFVYTSDLNKHSYKLVAWNVVSQVNICEE